MAEKKSKKLNLEEHHKCLVGVASVSGCLNCYTDHKPKRRSSPRVFSRIPANLVCNALRDTVDFSFLSHSVKNHNEELGNVSRVSCASCFGDFGPGFGCRWCIQLIDVHVNKEGNELF